MTHSLIQKLVFTAIFAGTVAAFVRSDNPETSTNAASATTDATATPDVSDPLVSAER